MWIEFVCLRGGEGGGEGGREGGREGGSSKTCERSPHSAKNVRMNDGHKIPVCVCVIMRHISIYVSCVC